MPTTNNSRTTQFIKNIVGSALLQIVTIITGFISPRLMLTAFGSEINGITSSITQFISYLTLVEAGLSNATVFALYKPLADRDIKERDAVISASRIAYLRVGILFVALSLGLALIYPYIGSTDAMSNWELGLLVLVLCSNTTINFFILAKYRTLLTADQCGYIISFSSCAQLLTHLAIVYVTIQLGFPVTAVRAFGILSYGVTTLILAISVRLKYGKINYKAPPNMKALDKRHDAMFLQIMGVITAATPVVIMTALLDYKTISVYTIYNMIAGSVATCISVFTSGLGSAFGNIYAINDTALLKKTTEEFRVAFYALVTIVYTVMLSSLIPFVRLYTDGITDTNYLLPLFGILITAKGLLDNMKAPHGMLVMSFGKYREIRRQTIIQGVLIIASTFLFTKLWGLNGCMLALCVANVYMLVELLILTPKVLVEMSVRKNLRQIVQILVVVFGTYGISLAIPYQPDNYLSWLVYACVIGIFATVVTIGIFFLFDKTEMLSLWQRICILLKRGKNRVDN